MTELTSTRVGPHLVETGRRLGAAMYDFLIVAALWILCYFPLIKLGLATGTVADNFSPLHLALRLGIAFAYFGYSWTRGGRTLGGLAWKLVVVRADGEPLGWRDATARFGVALLYLVPVVLLESLQPATQSPPLFYAALLLPFLAGTGWCLIDPAGRAAHELPLSTRVRSTPVR